MAEYIGILAFLSLLMAGSGFFQWAVQDITQIVIIHLAVKPQYFLSIPEYDYDRDTSHIVGVHQILVGIHIHITDFVCPVIFFLQGFLQHRVQGLAVNAAFCAEQYQDRFILHCQYLILPAGRADGMEYLRIHFKDLFPL